jgi:asparagine synthetase B (glutamine-hydrolysing)
MIVRAAGHVISATNKTLEYMASGLSDPIVARAAFSLLGRDKIRHRQGKVALKRAAESWLPRETVYQPKASFSAPLQARTKRSA